MEIPKAMTKPTALDRARAVMNGVKQRLPSDLFEVHDATLFVSSESVTPRAVFGVGLIGVAFGIVVVQFEIPTDVGATVDLLTSELIRKRPRLH
jgi:hypothetical protein